MGVLVLRHQAHGQEPHRQGQVGVLHHGAHDAGGLVAADKAFPQLAALAVAGEKKALAAAVRALPAMGPALCHEGTLALLLRAIKRVELRQ